MKIKLRDIVNSWTNIPENKDTGTEAETSPIENLLKADFKFKVSYRIRRLTDKLQAILDTYNLQRQELIKKFGEKDEETGNFTVKDPEKLKEFWKELNEMLDVEEEIEFDKIKQEEVEDVKLKAKDIVNFIFE